MKNRAPIDVKPSIKADDIRPMNGDGSVFGSSCASLTLKQNEVFPSSQPVEDEKNVKNLYHSMIREPKIVPENDPNEDEEVAELEQLISNKPIPKGRIEIIDDSEKRSLFAPRLLRSQTNHNKSSLQYDFTAKMPGRTRRSFEKQSESDFIDDSAVIGKSRREVHVYPFFVECGYFSFVDVVEILINLLVINF
uniref:Uncharacterized protein n=1 Tax=Panagrolaimus sp. ES5 TaxID=591445 RepID=A0AC34F6P6_9BILA